MRFHYNTGVIGELYCKRLQSIRKCCAVEYHSQVRIFEPLTVQVSYDKSLPVLNGAYQFVLRGIVIPTGSNSITVKTTNVKSMSVGLKQKVWTTVTVKVVNGVSTLTRNNLSPGTYHTIIYGNSGASSIQLSVVVAKTLTSDSKGNYIYVYNSAGMPKGKYIVKVGNVTKSFTLK